MARNRLGEADTPKHVALRRGFSERVSQRMAELGLSQVDVAEALDCSQSSVSRWFRPGLWSVPEGIHLMQLGDLLEVNFHWLVTGRGPRGLPGAGHSDDARYADGARAAFTAVRLMTEAELERLNLRAPGAATPDQLRRDRDEAERRYREAVEAEQRATVASPLPLRRKRRKG